jgi:cyanophycin synthetase
MTAAEPVSPIEIRVLEGPNLYFPRPAIKVTLDVPGWTKASEERVSAVAEALRVPGSGKPGAAGTEQRLRMVARIARNLTRALAGAEGTRSLAVRSRADLETGWIVTVFPWRRKGSAEALAQELALGMKSLLRRSPQRVVAEAGKRLRATPPGSEPEVPDPTLPVIQVTGTNGKTTTVRLLAALVRAAGKRVAYSSTDGVYDGEELVEKGDYSGFGGASRAMSLEPDVAVLETARGGILLRGMGVLHNDVAVVTNVSEDHLGLQGVHTIDQLAEVKSAITRITRREGWDVLNADDPRVLAMRRQATGRIWLFSMDADHPAIRDVLAEGGRATTVLDGRIGWLEHHDVHPLIPTVDVPVTLAGISRVNVQNAMAAASAALALGLPQGSVVKGLKSFVLDPERNPGRANLFSLDGRIIVIDYAHNEAGMIGLTEVLEGLRKAGAEIWLAICTAGDRTDAILRAFAFRAASSSDHLSVAELLYYLRGRTREDIVEQLRAGAAEAGVDDVPCYEDELDALQAMLKQSESGDVLGVTALGMRPEIFAWLDSAGAARLGPAEVKRVVRVAASSRRSRPAARRRQLT